MTTLAGTASSVADTSGTFATATGLWSMWKGGKAPIAARFAGGFAAIPLGYEAVNTLSDSVVSYQDGQTGRALLGFGETGLLGYSTYALGAAALGFATPVGWGVLLGLGLGAAALRICKETWFGKNQPDASQPIQTITAELAALGKPENMKSLLTLSFIPGKDGNPGSGLRDAIVACAQSGGKPTPEALKVLSTALSEEQARFLLRPKEEQEAISKDIVNAINERVPKGASGAFVITAVNKNGERVYCGTLRTTGAAGGAEAPGNPQQASYSIPQGNRGMGAPVPASA